MLRTSIIFAAGVLLVALSRACAFEGPPPSLATLVQQSDVIVVAEVDRVKETANEHLTTAVATLRVQIVAKGNPKTNSVRVEFGPKTICPAPPRYREGERVLAFLVKEEDVYRTIFERHGTKILSDPYVDHLVASVNQHVATQRDNDNERHGMASQSR